MNRRIEAGKPGALHKEEVSEPKTEEQVLRSAAALYRRSMLEADIDIDLGNLDGFTDFTLSAGKAIAGLRESLSGTNGESRLLQSDRARLMELSDIARKLVEEHDLYSIGMFMYIKGSRLDEPNELEKLIEKAYPQEAEESPYVDPAVGELTQGNLGEEVPKKVFDNPPQGVPAPVIQFLSLAEQEGAYAALSETTRQRIEMRFLEGLSVTDIAGIQRVSKQAVSQTIKLFPKMLLKKMTRDVYLKTTEISYSEILLSYANCLLYFQEQQKPKT